MAENKKYYWLKLKRDFFKRHDIKIVESMPNGKDYILFYLKLLLESIDHEGTLRFSETIPYNEQMLSVVTDTNIDIVRSAMKLFIELNMMTVFDDQTIYMTEVDKLIGSETEWAKKKREQRLKKDNVPQLSSKCPTEIDKDKEKYKDTDIEVDVEEDLATATATEEDVLKLVCGRLENREWQDKSGNKRISTEIVAEEVSFVGSASETATETKNTAYIPQAYANPNFASSSQFEELADNEGLPF